jgi:hypothetical protein
MARSCKPYWQLRPERAGKPPKKSRVLMEILNRIAVDQNGVNQDRSGWGFTV